MLVCHIGYYMDRPSTITVNTGTTRPKGNTESGPSSFYGFDDL